MLYCSYVEVRRGMFFCVCVCVMLLTLCTVTASD
jgi:hypothetical protein